MVALVFLIARGHLDGSGGGGAEFASNGRVGSVLFLPRAFRLDISQQVSVLVG